MSFFNRQPEMFDAKKRFGSGNVNSDRGGLNSDEGESVPESWVELAPSRASLCSSVEAVMVDEGSGEASANKDSRLSPVSLQSPHGVEFETSLDQVKYRLVKDIKNTDWIWDWSSRPEKQEQVRPSKMSRNRSGQIGSTLTTPPNSPEPELGSSEFEFKTAKVPKRASSVFLRFEVIVGLVVSNVLTFVLGATIGFCICKKIDKSDTLKLNYYYW